MKLIQIGSNADLSNILLKKNKSHTNFGCMHYLQEKIRLYSIKAINEYYVWESIEGRYYLCIRNNTEEWMNELNKISNEIMKQNPTLVNEMKLLKDGEIYFKMTTALGRTIPQNCHLYITVDIFALFVKEESSKGFLQMEVASFNAEPLAFDLSPFYPNVENQPNADQ